MMFFNTLPIIIVLLTSNNVGASKWWNGWSPNDNNDRYQRETLPVTPATTTTEFKQLWYTKLNGPAIMSPTVYENYIYVATFTGMFYCLHADNGIILWQGNLSDIINNGHVYYSRTSPLVYNNLIILGLSDRIILQAIGGNGSYFIAFDRFTGVLQWQTRVSSHPTSRITSTPQIANNRLFIGISSREEAFTRDPEYPCCTFQGSMIALDVNTGTFLWETKMIPDNKGTTTGYAGKLKGKMELLFATR
jgi:polyvinyl alcohol dehydrogenase (cytochrome)